MVTRTAKAWLIAAAVAALGGCNQVLGLDKDYHLDPAGGGGTSAAGGSVTTEPGGAGGAGGTTSTATSGTCDESPCKLTPPQCGCAAGQMCTLDGAFQRVCGPAGVIEVGQVCDNSSQCVLGAACTNLTGPTGICFQLCATDADCGAALCLLSVIDGNGSAVPGAALCTSECTPVSNAGCGPDLTCGLGQEPTGQMRPFSYCHGHGSGGQGAMCASPFDCALGAGCFGVDAMTNKCLQYCDTAAPTCPGSSTCQPLGLNYKGTDWGACF